jgi:hypothetical protein
MTTLFGEANRPRRVKKIRSDSFVQNVRARSAALRFFCVHVARTKRNGPEDLSSRPPFAVRRRGCRSPSQLRITARSEPLSSLICNPVLLDSRLSRIAALARGDMLSGLQ